MINFQKTERFNAPAFRNVQRILRPIPRNRDLHSHSQRTLIRNAIIFRTARFLHVGKRTLERLGKKEKRGNENEKTEKIFEENGPEGAREKKKRTGRGRKEGVGAA